MNYRKIAMLLCFFFFVIECKKKKCEEVVDQAYVYPIEAANGKSFEERIKMFKIPDQILHCLSTKALLKSSLDHPLMSLMWSMSDLQRGFDKVRVMCNGYEEFWGRGDKFQELISLYKKKDFNPDWNSYSNLEIGYYMDDIVRLELIISQHEILIDLTPVEKIELFQLVLENQKKKYAEAKYWSSAGMATSCAILSRIMYLGQYQPLITEYTIDEYMLILTDYILILDSDTVDKVMSLSEEYLKILKSGN